jgi:hypothetical protein
MRIQVMKALKDIAAYDPCEWGLRDGQLFHIDQVESGKSCDCRCPDCNDPLIAKKGKVNAHHFAHKNLEPSTNCGESLLHLAAKECVRKLVSIMTPGYSLKINTEHGRLIIDNPDECELIIKKVKLEAARSTYRPDCTVYAEGMSPLDIEIKVTHGVDEEKQLKVLKEGVEMIEVDLSALMGKSITHKELVDQIYCKAPRYWVYKASRHEYKFIVNSMVKLQKQSEERINKSWRRSYRKWCEEVDRLHAKLWKDKKQIVTSNMSNEEAVDALGQAVLNKG